MVGQVVGNAGCVAAVMRVGRQRWQEEEVGRREVLGTHCLRKNHQKRPSPAASPDQLASSLQRLYHCVEYCNL